VVGFVPNGGEVCASGVSIDPDLVDLDVDLSVEEGSVVVTNYHVVANTGSRPSVKLGGEGEQYEAEVIKQAPEMDLALLFVRGARFPAAALADSSPEGGTPVRAIGFPNNSPLTVKESTLLGFTQNCLALAPCLAIKQGTITHGNSGGPLEASGKVIGITQGETTEEIAIPVEQVQQFLSNETPSSSVSPQFEPGYPPGPPGPPGPPRRSLVPPPYGGPPPPPGWWR
jgi:S1-C subfamily serine protease